MSHRPLARSGATALLALFLAVPALPAGAADGPASATGAAETHKEIEELRAEIARLKAQAGGSDRIAEMERRLDLLAQELEKTRTGGAVDSRPAEGAKGLAPAASKVYGIERGVSIGGYGEVLYEHFSGERQDGRDSGRRDRIDYLRQILYVGYKFSDKILFNSEIEFEHAKTGEEAGGEVAIEFGYLEFQPWKSVGARAGMLLVPVGFLNELHEPPIFHGARRPEVERAIIPSTWRENGAGLFGEKGPVQWRAYVVAGLNSAGFDDAGIRGGRQEGSESTAEDFALTGRVDYSAKGLLLGASVFTGQSGQGATVGTREIGGRVTIWDAHAQYERRGLHLRALFARSTVGDAALINEANGLTGNKSVGETQWGWYGEAAFDVLSLRSAPSRWSASPFVRYERLNTQDEVPAGFSANPARDRRALTLGVGVKPITNVVFKAEFQKLTNEARTGVNQFNLAVGYLF